ncbi:SEL1-like repeat protein [Microbulbifer sp. 2201CG32-9]|uniref:hypothetical protein n=1 Tax=Microbulbifer sp. 2201CG32-9 TaxID=3232309 RepID=UPI00345C046E
MNKSTLTVLLLIMSFACTAEEETRESFDFLIEENCEFQEIGSLDKDSCKLAVLNSEIKKSYLTNGRKKELSLAQLETLVLKLSMKNYSMLLIEKYISEEKPCKAQNIVSSMLDEGPAYLYAQGVFYNEGICVELSHEMAYSYFEKASRKGHLDAAYNVAFMAYFGRGVEQKVQLAAALLATLSAFNYEKALKFVDFLIDSGYADRNNFSAAVESRKPVYELLKQRKSRVILAGDELKKFMAENSISKPAPFDSLQAPIVKDNNLSSNK